MNWLHLIVAIVAEAIATAFLNSSEGFMRLWPSVAAAIGYATALFFLSLTLRSIPAGILRTPVCMPRT